MFVLALQVMRTERSFLYVHISLDDSNPNAGSYIDIMLSGSCVDFNFFVVLSRLQRGSLSIKTMLARLLRCSANSSFKLNHLRHRLRHPLQLRLRPGRCSGFDSNGEFANDTSNYFAYHVFVALASTPMANPSTSTPATACTPTFVYLTASGHGLISR